MTLLAVDEVSAQMPNKWVVPSSSERHIAKLLDRHMLCVSTGRQRTRAEFETISTDSGWYVADV